MLSVPAAYHLCKSTFCWRCLRPYHGHPKFLRFWVPSPGIPVVNTHEASDVESSVSTAERSEK